MKKLSSVLTNFLAAACVFGIYLFFTWIVGNILFYSFDIGSFTFKMSLGVTVALLYLVILLNISVGDK